MPHICPAQFPLKKNLILGQSISHFRACSAWPLNLSAESSSNSPSIGFCDDFYLFSPDLLAFCCWVLLFCPVSSSLFTLHSLLSGVPVFPNGDTVGILTGTIHCVQLSFILQDSYPLWSPLTHASSNTPVIVPIKNLLAYLKIFILPWRNYTTHIV